LDNWIEFNPPAENPGNRFLASDRPMEKVDSTGKFDLQGNLGLVTRYFIAPAEWQRLLDLFQRFQLPERLHPELIWCYLNMVFAGAMSEAGEQFHVTLDDSMQKLYALFDALACISDGTHKVKTANITIEPVNPDTKIGKELQTLHLKGKLDTGFLDDVLKLYRGAEYFDTLNKFYEVDKQKSPGKLRPHMGYKNDRKHKQSHYAWALFEYLLNNVFSDLRAYTNDLPKMKQERDRLKKIYPDRQLCHFIGLLMLEAGLLSATDDMDDNTLIDLMKKKLASSLSRRAEHARAWKGKNDQPK
jgi:hypothetical protein